MIILSLYFYLVCSYWFSFCRLCGLLVYVWCCNMFCIIIPSKVMGVKSLSSEWLLFSNSARGHTFFHVWCTFWYRLATEREEAKLQKEKPQKKDQMSLLESLKKTGVVDFHMRAVPGTEVPDHKVWWGRCIRKIKQEKTSSLHLNSCQIYALCKENH